MTVGDGGSVFRVSIKVAKVSSFIISPDMLCCVCKVRLGLTGYRLALEEICMLCDVFVCDYVVVF